MPSSLPLFTETSFAKSRRVIRCSEAISTVARRLWPVKTAQNLAGRADVTCRTAELWLEGRNDISGQKLTELIRSDAGFEILSGLMEEASPLWWRDFQRGVRLAEIEKKIEWQRAQLARLKAELP